MRKPIAGNPDQLRANIDECQIANALIDARLVLKCRLVFADPLAAPTLPIL
jgi:hypothetical protein